MKLILENTEEIVHINGIPARVWRGRTETGIEVHALITQVAVAKDDDCSQFDRELKEQAPPRDAAANVWPLRTIL